MEKEQTSAITILEEKDFKLLESQISLVDRVARLKPNGTYGKVSYRAKNDFCSISFHHENYTKPLYTGK